MPMHTQCTHMHTIVYMHALTHIHHEYAHTHTISVHVYMHVHDVHAYMHTHTQMNMFILIHYAQG